MYLFLIILLILLCLGGLPTWGYHSYGYAPSGVGMVLLIALIASIVAAMKASSAKQDTHIVKTQQSIIHEQVGAMAEKVETVEVNTNSRVSRQDELIKSLSDQVAGLTAQIAQQEQNRAVLAAEAKLPPQVQPPGEGGQR